MCAAVESAIVPESTDVAQKPLYQHFAVPIQWLNGLAHLMDADYHWYFTFANTARSAPKIQPLLLMQPAI